MICHHILIITPVSKTLVIFSYCKRSFDYSYIHLGENSEGTVFSHPYRLFRFSSSMPEAQDSSSQRRFILSQNPTRILIWWHEELAGLYFTRERKSSLSMMVYHESSSLGGSGGASLCIENKLSEKKENGNETYNI
jgi:hypothetical protein